MIKGPKLENFQYAYVRLLNNCCCHVQINILVGNSALFDLNLGEIFVIVLTPKIPCTPDGHINSLACRCYLIIIYINSVWMSSCTDVLSACLPMSIQRRLCMAEHRSLHNKICTLFVIHWTNMQRLPYPTFRLISDGKNRAF